MMIRLIALVAVILAVAGCGREIKKPPQTTTIEVSYDNLLSKKHIDLPVKLGVGDTLQVILASNSTTGYQWTEQTTISDPAVLVQRSHFYAGPSGARPPGTAGTETWTFEALATGTTTVATSYGQPWPGGAKDSWTFSTTVTVH